MNVFFIIDGILCTPSLDGTILPGITRDSILTLAREKGIPVVHLAQMFQRSGFTLVALKSTGIKNLCTDMKGKSVGVRPSGNEYPAVALFRKCGLTSSLDPKASSPDVIKALADFYDSLDPGQQQKVREMMQRRKGWMARG